MQVSFEQVLRWDPDAIVTIDPGFYGEARRNPLWRTLRAVTSGEIYLSPNVPYGWIDFPPSVNRLIEIVGAIGVPVTALFETRQALIVPEADGSGVVEVLPGVFVAPGHLPPVTLGQGVVYRRLSPVEIPGLDVFESYYPPGASSSVDGAMLVHHGHEIGSVIAGTLTFEFSEGTVEVAAGGSLSFAADRPHRVVNNSQDTPAISIWDCSSGRYVPRPTIMHSSPGTRGRSVATARAST